MKLIVAGDAGFMRTNFIKD